MGLLNSPKRLATLLAVCWLSAFSAMPVCAAEDSLQRTIEFRNGTVLRVQLPDVELPWRRVLPDGQILSQPVKLSQVKRLRLVRIPATEQVATVRRLITQLGDNRFKVREQAQNTLKSIGAKFRTILEPALSKTNDVEVHWRLKEVLRALPKDVKSMNTNYDLLTLSGNQEVLQGDVGQWSFRIKYRGAMVTLDRTNVVSLSDQPLAFRPSIELPISRKVRVAQASDNNRSATSASWTKVIPKDEDEFFPRNTRWINFERGPKGESLVPGRDIGKTFVPWGCTLTSSIKSSFISVEPYNVGGRSGGRSAATHDPLYHGSILIRFCAPGNERIPAGVHTVGFWLSHIAPEGTTLEAYDAHDRKIVETKTSTTGRDFLAVASSVPIAYVKVVPDTEIDPDYAIDDLRFDEPFPLVELGAPGLTSLLLTNGERLQGRTISVDGDDITLQTLTINVDRLTIPLREIAAVIPPRNPLPIGKASTGCLALFTDGSMLHLHGQAGPQVTRFPKLQIDPTQLVALWGSQTTPTDPEPSEWPKNGALLSVGGDRYKTLSSWKLGDKAIQSPDLDAAKLTVTYDSATSPPIWFQPPPYATRDAGLLRLTSGDEIVLSDKNGFVLQGWTADGVTITRDDQRWTIGFREVRSFILPQ